MCGRYVYGDRITQEVEKELGIAPGSIVMSTGDVTPGMSPVVLSAGKTGDKEFIRVSNMHWGLTGKDKKLIINARAESALEKPMFDDNMKHRRCVMPASAFYEWDKDKNKVTFYREDKRPIYLAGFYGLSENRDSFTILTTAANESMIRVHDRMPLMIDKDMVRDWLYDKEAAKEMLGMKMLPLSSHQDYEQMSLFLAGFQDK